MAALHSLWYYQHKREKYLKELYTDYQTKWRDTIAEQYLNSCDINYADATQHEHETKTHHFQIPMTTIEFYLNTKNGEKPCLKQNLKAE